MLLNSNLGLQLLNKSPFVCPASDPNTFAAVDRLQKLDNQHRKEVAHLDIAAVALFLAKRLAFFLAASDIDELERPGESSVALLCARYMRWMKHAVDLTS